jgi:hypothetical protein
MNRLNNKKYIGALISARLVPFIHKQSESKESDKDQEKRIKEQFRSKSTYLVRSNCQVKKMFGPRITTTVNSDMFERFKPDCKSFSVNNFCNYNQKFQQMHKLNLLFIYLVYNEC